MGKPRNSRFKGYIGKDRIFMLALALIIVFLMSFGQVDAAGELFWNEEEGMNRLLNVSESYTGGEDDFTEDETIMLELDISERAPYYLYYYLESGYQTLVEFDRTSDSLEIVYHVRENDGSGTFSYSDPIETQTGFTEVAETLAAADYREMDYTPTVPEWQDVTVADLQSEGRITSSGAITFSIEESASNEYPGVAFDIDGKYVFIRWDAASDLIYYQTTGYKAGQMMPVRYETPKENDDEEQIIIDNIIMKQLSSYSADPTHFIPDAADATDTDNLDVNPVSVPDDTFDPADEIPPVYPGGSPGFDISFKQPRTMDATTWDYDFGADLSGFNVVVNISDLGSDANTQFKFGMNTDAGDMSILEAAEMSDNNQNVNVQYEYSDDTYTVHLVQDKQTPDLHSPDNYVEWFELDGSRIYDLTITLEQTAAVTDNYEFGDMNPPIGFAYTYMNYFLERTSANEGQLVVTPYNVGELEEIEYIILNTDNDPFPDDQLDRRKDLYLRSYQSGDSDNEIYIPIEPKSGSFQDFYQIITVYVGRDIYSQIVNYNAEADESYPLTIPSIDLVDNVTVIPPQEPYDDTDYENDLNTGTLLPEKVETDLVWTAPENRGEFKELDETFADPDFEHLYFEMYINTLPLNDSDEDAEYELIKVFEVTESGGDYAIEQVYPSTNLSLPSDQFDFISGYDVDDELFRMDDVYIRGDVSGDNQWTPVITYDSAGNYTVTANEAEVLFPGVNYVRMQTVTIIDGIVERSDPSLPASLSLDMDIEEVPIVESLDYEPLEGSPVDQDTGIAPRDAGIYLEWVGVDDDTYEERMLDPLGQDITDVYYTVYIAENDVDMSVIDHENPDPDDYVPMWDTGSDPVYFSDNLRFGEDTTTTNIDFDYYVNIETSSRDFIDDLRDGKILYFNMQDHRYNPGEPYNGSSYRNQLIGLDVNRNYNIRIVTNFIVESETESRYSEASEILSALVPKLPDGVEEEESPVAPENFTVSPDDEASSNNAILSWTAPVELVFDDDNAAFEILAIEDRALSEDLDDKGLKLTEILWDEELDGVVTEGWRLYQHDGTIYLRKYTLSDQDTDNDGNLDIIETDLAFGDVENGDLGERDTLTLTYRVIDDENAPNRVNYYYVRSVVMNDEAPGSNNSVWIAGALTTAQVSKPINLAIDYDTFTYDAKDELILRFDVPFTDVDLIPDTYGVDIQVKGEDDSTYEEVAYGNTLLTTPSSEADAAPTGYTRVFYRITDLEPGKSYNLKVRIQDKTQPQEGPPGETPDWPYSQFSDTISTRTEFDQTSYDKDNKYREYLEYYREKAEELKLEPYFILEEDSDELMVKYREDYAEGLVQRYTNREFLLYSTDKETTTYYIPSGMLDSANDLSVTLVVETMGHEVSLRPDTLGPRITEEIDDVLELIDSYDEDAEDYYIEIIVEVEEYDDDINGEDPSSYRIDVDLAVLESEVLDEELDTALVTELDSVIADREDDVIDDLEDELEGGIDDDELLDIVLDVLEDVRDDFVQEAEDIFDDYIDDTEDVDVVEQSIAIGISPDEPSNYQYVYTYDNGYWRFTESTYLNQRYYVESRELNPYITVSSDLSSSALKDNYGQVGVEVINTYNLNSIFSDSQMENPTRLLVKDQWFEAVAYLTGAESSEDHVDYLEDLGISLNTGGLSTVLRYDEALVVYAEAYAYIHELSLDSVFITDYLMIEDIDEVQEDYRDTLLKAANAGIIETQGGFIDPDHSLTMEDTMNLLISLHQGME